jgi:acyl-CoA reductase-like NAD-dependent aldehyde dehydrogenase
MAMTEYALIIDGNRVPATEHFEVLNPATGAVLAFAPECSADQLDAAFAAARAAFPSWSADADRRRACCK